MHCADCEHYKGKCDLEKIYASGFLKDCPYLGKPEPIIPPSGGNLQVMGERIKSPEGLERIDITPVPNQEDGGYNGKIMLCYGGKGIETLSRSDPAPPSAAVYFAWADAIRLIRERKIKSLESLIPLIERRLSFDYSMVVYLPVGKQAAAIIPAPKPEKQKKGPGLVRPACEEMMLEIETPENGEKPSGINWIYLPVR